jgi:transposase
MLGLGAATRVFVATGGTDMRLGFNGLYALVVGQLKEDPQSGHLFLFANKRRDRMKILLFDNFSLWVCARRMEKGRLHWPSSDDGRVQLTREEFALLIGGIDLRTATKRKWYRRGVAEQVNSSPKSGMNTGESITYLQSDLR